MYIYWKRTYRILGYQYEKYQSTFVKSELLLLLEIPRKLESKKAPPTKIYSKKIIGRTLPDRKRWRRGQANGPHWRHLRVAGPAHIRRHANRRRCRQSPAAKSQILILRELRRGS